MAGDGGSADVLITPVPVSQLQALGAAVTGFEQVQIVSNACGSACVTKPNCAGHGSCTEGTNPGEVKCACDPGWTGDDCSVPHDPFDPYSFDPDFMDDADFGPACTVAPSISFAPNGMPVFPPFIEGCSNAIQPVVDPDFCLHGYIPGPAEPHPDDPCPILGLEPTTDPGPGCTTPQPMEYCTEREEPFFLPTGEILSRTVYEPMPDPGLDPDRNLGTRCEAVAANPLCCVLYGTIDQLAHECDALPGEPLGDPCTTAADCISSKFACVEGRCQLCAQFSECPDADAIQPMDGEYPHDPKIEEGPGDEAVPESQPDDPPLPDVVTQPLPGDCTNNACRVGRSRVVEGASATDVFGEHACGWDDTVVPEQRAWGQGGDRAMNPSAPETEWHRTKGNARFNIELSAGAAQDANFETRFSEGAGFDVMANAHFGLWATVWGTRHEVLLLDAGGSASPCEWDVHLIARLRGENIKIGGNEIGFDESSPPIPDCETLRTEIPATLKRVNEMMHDLQLAIDVYSRWGGVHDAFVSSQARAELEQRYRDLVQEYRGVVTEFQHAIGALDQGPLVAPFGGPEVPIRLIGAQVAYAVGPFRAGLEVSASAFWGVSGEVGLTYGIAPLTFDPSVHVFGKIGPRIGADAQAAFFLGIGNRFIGVDAGIRAQLNLITVEFPLVATMGIERASNTPVAVSERFLERLATSDWNYNWDFGAAVVIKALSGKVDLFVRATVLFLTKTWKKTLADWDGFEQCIALFGNAACGSQPSLVPKPSDGPIASLSNGISFPALTFDGITPEAGTPCVDDFGCQEPFTCVAGVCTDVWNPTGNTNHRLLRDAIDLFGAPWGPKEAGTCMADADCPNPLKCVAGACVEIRCPGLVVP